MMNQVLVTIIIPAFNVDKYIEECVASVATQTYSNLQIIIVDDGSTDSTSRICDELSKKDNRIVVLHKDNGGQAEARNYALSSVKGEYVLYVDSDDIIHRRLVEILVDIVISNDADIASCDFEKFFDKPDIKDINLQNYCVDTTTSALKVLLYQRGYNQGPCCKLIKSEIAVNTPFPEGIIYEDMATVYRWFDKAERIVNLRQPLYYYRQHRGSTMRAVFSKRKLDRISVTETMRAFINNKYPNLIDAMNSRWLLSNLQVLMDLPFGNKYKYYKKEIKANIKSVRKTVIKDRNVKKSLKIMAISTYLGINFTMVEGKIYNRLVNRNT